MLRVVYRLQQMKRFLAILGIIGVVWSCGPAQYLNATNTTTIYTYPVDETTTVPSNITVEDSSGNVISNVDIENGR